MPLYEYRCKKCGNVSEILVNSSGKSKPACEACGSRNMEKLLSAPAVHVKGGGTGGGAPACGRETRCCGRPEPCDAPPCTKD